MAKRLRFALTLLALAFVSRDCATVPITGRSQLLLISDDEMAAASDDAFAQLYNYLRQSGKLLSPSESPDAEAITALVNKVSNRLIDVAGIRTRFAWQISVVKSPAVNAMVTPNGKIIVFTGILPVAKNEAGWAAVIGHEIGHVIARHTAERLSAVLAGNLAPFEPFPKPRQDQSIDRSSPPLQVTGSNTAC